MKRFLLLPLLVLSSCVSETQKPSDTVGATRVYQESLSTVEDQERLREICLAMERKESELPILVNSQYKFSYSRKGCNDTALPAEKIIVTTLKRSGMTYFFEGNDGQEFGFGQVETTTEGVMRQVCKFGGVSSSPVRESETSATAVWWSTFTSGEHCKPGFGTLCIHLQTGKTRDGINYAINSNEWIKFKIQDQNDGFFIERKLISSAGCKDGKELEIRAVLK